MPPEPYNPARHGGVLERYNAFQRSGGRFAFLGVIIAAIGFLMFLVFRVADHDVFLAVIVPIVFILIGVGFVVMGVVKIVRAWTFNDRVRRLRQNGLVIRGTIKRVRHERVLWGASRLFWQQKHMAIEDTGQHFRVTYAFNDANGRLREAKGRLPDIVGVKPIAGERSQVVINPQQPVVGQAVDILFDNTESVVLRVLTTTAQV